ncbi:MAG: hypothetical protein WAM60_15910 [Candidatus Promineifilaceae bacterium]
MPEFPYGPPPLTRFQRSISDFRTARQRAAMENIIARLTGRSTELLSYDEVVNSLKIVSRSERGIREIPVDAIVGSVGRYTDFSRTFLPQRSSDAQRWARVASVPDFNSLPPIDVYQIGDAYFVLDGNHRVSIARQRGMLFIPAEVTEVQTRVPLPSNINPDNLILQAEYAAFLENTHLDYLRPDADLWVSVPGQYRKLENHMEVHRFFIEMAEGIELSDAEAVTRWYDEAYLPVVETVREQGILRGFPNRTETDLYLWVSEHQASVRNELGWQVRPEVAAADLAARFRPQQGSKFSRLFSLVVPERTKFTPRLQSWSQEKVAVRYSDRLFADLLVFLFEDQDNAPILEQALIIARRDDSRLHGLCPKSEETPTNAIVRLPGAPDSELRSWFEQQCQAAAIEGRLAFQTGDLVEVISERAALTDLVIYGRLSPTESSIEASQQLLSLIRHAPRPVFLATSMPVSLDTILLAYNGSTKSREALFAAAYMAERWGVSLTVVVALEDSLVDETAVTQARSYLEMHEVEADYIVQESDPTALILETAERMDKPLIIAGGFNERRFGRRGSGNVISQLIAEWQGALLVCP